MSDGSTWCPDCQRTSIKQITTAIPALSCLVNDLIESRENVVSKLNLRNSRGTSVGDANSKTNNPLFAQRRIENTITSVLFLLMQDSLQFEDFFRKMTELIPED